MSVDIENKKEKDNNCNKCEYCINFNAYYKKTQDRYEKTHFG